MRHLFVVNPTAGGGRTKSMWPNLAKLLRQKRVAFDDIVTQAPGHATQVAREAASEGYDAVVSVGGDGTIHEIVNGLVPGEAALGIIPIGTGNDFARALDLPLRDPEGAVDIIASGRRRPVDLGCVNGHYYVQVAGAGFDAQVADLANRSTRIVGGPVPYLAAVLRLLASYKNSPLKITIDGEVREQISLLVAIGNTRCYAGGMQMCPRAVVDDGRLDVCLVGDLSRLDTIRSLVGIFSGKHIHHPKVHYVKAENVRVEGPDHLLLHADGEIIGRLPGEFRIAAEALSVICPPPA